MSAFGTGPLDVDGQRRAGCWSSESVCCECGVSRRDVAWLPGPSAVASVRPYRVAVGVEAAMVVDGEGRKERKGSESIHANCRNISLALLCHV